MIILKIIEFPPKKAIDFEMTLVKTQWFNWIRFSSVQFGLAFLNPTGHVYLHLISLNDFLTPHVCPETSVEEISLKLASIFIASRHAPESNFLIY